MSVLIPDQRINEMRKLRILITAFIVSITLLGCEGDSIQIKDILDQFPIDEYYESEIFNDNFLVIYGKWELYDVTGGIHGGGHDLNFDYLRIKEYGMYAFIRNDSTLEYGQIRIDEQTNDFLTITFEPHPDSEIFMYDPEKYIEFSGMDTLALVSPCCDRYNYHLIKKE